MSVPASRGISLTVPWKSRALVLSAVVGCTVAATPDVAEADTDLKPWSGIGWNTVDAFVGWPTLFHVAAVASAPVFVQSGADTNTTNYFRDHRTWGHIGTGGEILGFVAPTLGTAGVWIVGAASKDDRTVVAAYAMIQSTVLVLTTVTVGKMITGRQAPDEVEQEIGSRDARESFHFFSHPSIWDGWPSGHTAVVTTLAATLASYYRNCAVTILGLTVAAYTGFSMTSYDGGAKHYLSDVVSGFLIGLPIGWSVGRGFRERFEHTKEHTNETGQTWSLAPLIAGDARGLSIVGTL